MFTLTNDYQIDKVASLLVALRSTVKVPFLFSQSLIFKSKFENRWVDVLDGGDRSCAKYVSTVLSSVDLAQVSASVAGLRKNLVAKGWREVTSARACRVVVWGQKKGNDGFNYDHVGICLNSRLAYCNDPFIKMPALMPIFGLKLHTGEVRPVECFYEHPELNF